MLSLSSTVVASQHQVSCDLSGEAAILNLANSVYYGLNSVGARVWNLIQQPKTASEIRDILLAQFAVEAGVLENDLLAFLDSLHRAGLVEVQR